MELINWRQQLMEWVGKPEKQAWKEVVWATSEGWEVGT